MSAAWFILFVLAWTGLLAATAGLITRGRVKASFAQLVWRGAALASLLPLLFAGLASFLPQKLPAALPDLPYVDTAAGAVSSASTSLQAAVSSPGWAWTAPTLFAVLVAGWAVRAGLALLGQLRLQHLKTRSVPCNSGIDAFPLTQLGIERAPSIRLIPAGSPFVAGLRQRAIYVPEGLQQAGDLRQIAIHECVHLKRGDLVTRPMERLIADLFWFSPFAWMMRRELDFWREAVCDEIASELSGDRIAYARTLTRAARLSVPPRTLPVASLVLPRKRSLPMRIDRLLETRPARSRPIVAVGASMAALALAPFAIAEVSEGGGDKARTSTVFEHAVLISPDAKITSNFGKRADPINKKAGFHKGTDIKAPMGTPVYTPACGTVVFSAFKEGYGETVEVAFEDGTKMRFAQLSERLVEKGDEVGAGMKIGKVGMSGRATGPHLHLEYWSPQKDAGTGRTGLAPHDPRTSEGLVLFAAG